MRKLFFCILLLVAISTSGCSREKYQKYSSSFDGLFNTVTIVTAYEKSREDFEEHFAVIYDEMLRLHKLYDIYNDYDGLNNAKTINDNAGVAPVKVDEDLLSLLEFGKQAYVHTDGAVNIALGSVLRVWHEYRENALKSPENAAIPDMDELLYAAAFTSIDDIIVDRTNGTVFLKNPHMSLDLGALAKGYAIELAGKRARENGFTSGIISAGGNIYICGKPEDGRQSFSIGIQNPFAAVDDEQIFDTIFAVDCSAVTSGDYQRFFIANGQLYNHIIDPKTLMPATAYSGVTIIHPDSGVAEMLSTALFIMPYDEGLCLVKELGGEAIWIYKDKSHRVTEGYKELSKLYGAKQ